MRFKWTIDKCKEIALNYTTRYEWQKKHKNSYNAALKNKWLDECYQHMRIPLQPWTLEQCKAEALKYNTRKEWENNNHSYQAACRNKWLDECCKHMKIMRQDWTSEQCKAEALKYSTRSEWNKRHKNSYNAAFKNQWLDECCQHMEIMRQDWALEQCREMALKYNTKKEWENKHKKTYQAARKNNWIDECCKHMPINSSHSTPEKMLFEEIKLMYPKAQKLVDKKVKIAGKSHIKGFELDIYIPELRKAIEFDGTYFHSFKGLKRGRPHWPDEDLVNYHQIKDDYFKNKGIKVLHIKEKEWIENPQECIDKCIGYLA